MHLFTYVEIGIARYQFMKRPQNFQNQKWNYVGTRKGRGAQANWKNCSEDIWFVPWVTDIPSMWTL